MRETFLLVENWLFHRGDINVKMPSVKGPIYTQSKTERKLSGPAARKYFDRPDPFYADEEVHCDGWETVQIPHDYVIGGAYSQEENNAHGYLPRENAWYRRHFKLSEDYVGKRVLLSFDGISGLATVYLNGCLMGRSLSSYHSFAFDITDYIRFGEDNVIAVYVNTEEFEGWWYQGGGIYRHVYLTVTEALAIDRYGVYAPTEKISDGFWRVRCETTVTNTDYTDASYEVESALLSAQGTVIASAAAKGSAAARGKGVTVSEIDVENPLLWHPDSPALYTVRTRLYKDGVQLDEERTRIGFRTVTVSPADGLRINGIPTYIKGVCAHQDFGLSGLAVPENIARYKVSLIREMGANGYRCSHYPLDTAYMDAFDEMGFIVMNEVRWFESTEDGLRQLRDLVLRDRNRPSVFFWSTGNEEPLFVHDIGRRIHRAMAAEIRRLDPQRFITAAVDRTPDKCTIYDDCDIVGINYNLGIYDTVHEQYPDKALFASECCATGTTRDWHFPTDGDGHITDRDIDTNSWFRGREITWRFLRERPYVIGGYQWAAVEHRGEAAWPAVCSKSGALDLFLQKKGAFYQNQSHWCEEPTVHIVTHWNFDGMTGVEKLVTVYTNCDTVELLLNGTSLGRKSIEPYGRGEWTVPYAPGTLSAVGYNGEREVCRHTRETTGRACALSLREVTPFRANGEDLLLLDCVCLDAAGRVVPDAAETVTFSVASPAVLVGTGSDNTDHVPVPASKRRMYMGVIRIAVRPTKGQDSVTVTARSAGCATAQITVYPQA